MQNCYFIVCYGAKTIGSLSHWFHVCLIVVFSGFIKNIPSLSYFSNCMKDLRVKCLFLLKVNLFFYYYRMNGCLLLIYVKTIYSTDFNETWNTETTFYPDVPTGSDITHVHLQNASLIIIIILIFFKDLETNIILN